MKTAVLVINSNRYPEHDRLVSCYASELAAHGFRCVCINMAENVMLHILYEKICSGQPSLLVSFDLAGFELLTETDDFSYNMIPCRMVHLLLHPFESYDRIWENNRFNFSMFFYVFTEEECRQLQKCFPDVPNWRASRELMDGNVSMHVSKMLLEIDMLTL